MENNKEYSSILEEHLYDTVLRTINIKDKSFEFNIAHASAGLCGETGEIFDLIKKYLYHGIKLDLTELKLEIGDLIFYLQFISYLIEHRLVIQGSKKYNVENYDIRTIISSIFTQSSFIESHISSYITYNGKLVKSNLFDEPYIENRIEDIFYQLIMLCKKINISIEDCVKMNIKILKYRYPNEFLRNSINKIDQLNEGGL